jgi:hypothetical protein
MHKVNLLLEANDQRITIRRGDVQTLKATLGVPDQALVEDKVYNLLTPRPVATQEVAEIIEFLDKVVDIEGTPPLVVLLHGYVNPDEEKCLYVYYPCQRPTPATSAPAS